MCGRFTITLDAGAVKEALQLSAVPQDWQPRYNVAPTQPVAVVIDAEARVADWMRWGLIPYWAKDAAIGNKLINARAETVNEKPSFRAAFQKRRCLILSNGFYEWKKIERGASQPFHFCMADGSPFAFAGLWEYWKSPSGEEVRSCTIITCAANACVAPVHGRMPVMLTGDALWKWLAPQPNDEMLLRMLTPYPAEAMTRRAVSTLVNSPSIDRAELLAALDGQ